MSDHERSLYYIRNHDNMGLQRDVRYQQYRSLKQQYDKGVISRDEYKIKFTKSQDKLIYIEAFFKKEASTVNFDIDC